MIATPCAAALREAAQRLRGHSETPRLDAELLLAHLLQKSRTWLFTWPEHPLDAPRQAAYQTLIERRRHGEPIAYLTGRREFWSLTLEVTPATLAIAHERPRCQIRAVDRSAAALAVARRNQARLGIHNLSFAQGDWLAPLQGERFHRILANPPYIASGDPHLRRGDLRYEPPEALIGGIDGLCDLRHIIASAPASLHDGGMILLEHGYDQGAEIVKLLLAVGFHQTRTLCDLSGHGRVAVGVYRSVA